jgi:hypothetical protein
MPPRQAGRAGLVLTGALGGLFVVAVVLWLYLRLAQVGQVERQVNAELGLPPGTLSLDAISDEGRLRISMRDLVLLSDAGDTVALVPRVRLWFDPADVRRDGPLVFTDVVLEDPDLRLVQSSAGEWNIFQALRVQARGEEISDREGGRPLLFRDVRVRGGRVALALPTEAVDTATFVGRMNIPREMLGGVPHQVYVFTNVDARLPRLVLGGEEGWEVEVGELSARSRQPELRIREMRGRFAAQGEDAVRFQVRTLRVGGSALSGSGVLSFAEGRIDYDVQIEASRLDFADVRALVPGFPAEGSARFTLATEPLGGGRTSLLFTGLGVDALDARLAGRLGLVVGGGAVPAFRDTDLSIASLRLEVLKELGFLGNLPLAGVIEGDLSTAGIVTAEAEGALRVDLRARVTPDDDRGAEPSILSAVGTVALGGPETALRLSSLRLGFDPLYLATLRLLAPESPERLRGTIVGGVTVSGSLAGLRLSDGDLTYAVGDAAPTRLAQVEGTVSLRPALAYDIRARANPLALATLTELFPGLPFRTAVLSGPIALAGGAEALTFSADLDGAAGGIAVRGELAFGAVPRFDVSGSVRTLTPAALLSAELPVEGAVTGTFAARGIASDFRFSVDLEQTAGRFALQGRLREGEAGGAPRFTVGGEVSAFRIGALIGRPNLFPAPMSGSLSLTGGGAEPYAFDVDLRGDGVVLDLEGSYRTGEVPAYSARGTVRGLDLSRLPFEPRLPRTTLNARIDIDGSGTTPETLRGSFLVRAEGSSVSGFPMDVAVLDMSARDGELRVDTLALQLASSRLAAGGSIGLTTPAARPLTFSFSSPDLATISRAAAGTRLPPDLSGAVQAEGWVSGTLDYPHLVVALTGRDLRFNAWGAGQLALDADLNRVQGIGWSGEAKLVGQAITLGTGESFERIQLSASGDQRTLGVGLHARRNRTTDVAASGLIDFVEGVPRGFTFETLDARIEGTAWALENPARIRWGDAEGLTIENLVIERSDGGDGSIVVQGVLPPTGVADLSVRVRALELGSLGQLIPNAPALEGVAFVDAVLQGPVDDPQLDIDGAIESFTFRGATVDSVSLTAAYRASALQANVSIWRSGVQLLDSEVRLPMRLSLESLVPSFSLLRDQPLYARADAEALDLALLTAAVPQLAGGEGTFTAHATVGGTIAAPELEGQASVHRGAVQIVPLGVTYRNIAASLSLDGQRVTVDSIRAFSDGRGRLAGTVDLRDEAVRVDLSGTLESFEVMDAPDGTRVQVTGMLSLIGELPQPVLAGELTITESTFQIPDLAPASTVELTDLDIGQVGPDTIAPSGLLPPFLAGVRVSGLVVNVGESVWLNSDDARIQIAGERLEVYRTGEDVRVFGELRAERGRYTLRIGPLVREFEIVSGGVQFFGTGDLNPELNIIASNRIRTVQGTGGTREFEVLVNISGTVQFPRISLTSNTRPPLPESEILSLLLFGRQSFELGVATGGLAQDVILQEVLGRTVFAPIEQFFLQTGLIDYVQFRSAARGEFLESSQTLGLTTLGYTTIEIGSEVADNIFLTLECGVGAIFGGTGGTNCGTSVQVELGRDFTASAAYEPINRRDRLLQVLSFPGAGDYQWSFGLRKRWEYGISNGTAGPLLDEPVTGVAGAEGPGGARPGTAPDTLRTDDAARADTVPEPRAVGEDSTAAGRSQADPRQVEPSVAMGGWSFGESAVAWPSVVPRRERADRSARISPRLSISR